MEHTPKEERIIKKFRKQFGNPDGLAKVGYRTVDLRPIENYWLQILREAIAEEMERVKKIIPHEKPMNVFSFVLKGEELEQYMRHKGWNECRGAIVDALSHLTQE